MTRADLDAIILTANRATKGPWKSYIEGRDHTSGSNFIMTDADNNRDYDIESNLREADQDFIAIARNTVPELVNEIFRLQKILNDNAISF